MSRLPRVKVDSGEGWYHVTAKVSDYVGHYALEKAGCREKLLQTLTHYAGAYFSEVGAFSVMGNHWHLVVKMEESRSLSRKELQGRLAMLHPKKHKKMGQSMTEKDWTRLAERLFDVSELMRNIQSTFGIWFNKTFNRRGGLWQERFKSTLLGDAQAVLDCMLYVDLNPVRAGLVKRPEEHKGSSLHYREAGAHRDLLMPLRGFLGQDSEKQALTEYRSRAYHRGNVPTKRHQARISDQVLAEEEARGFKARGLFLKKLRHFTDGVVLGTEDFVKETLRRVKRHGVYARRVNSIPHLQGLHHTLREQRSHALVC